MIVKVCGMRLPSNIRQVEMAGADLIGFIFYPPSPRYAGSLPPDYLPRCGCVGVFVNDDVDHILRIAHQWNLWGIQLHGSESPFICRKLQENGLKVIKAFGVKGDFLPALLDSYQDCCDMFLFDTATPRHGGSGLKFDWNILYSYRGSVPFLLSGGLGLDSIECLRSFSHPRCIGYDINSAFEIQPGIKDSAMIQKFISETKKFENHEPHQQTF